MRFLLSALIVDNNTDVFITITGSPLTIFLSINKTSIGLIEGREPADIVREEIRKNEIENYNDNDSIDSDKEREFNLEERLKIRKLEKKQQGLIDISVKNLKSELTNGRPIVEKTSSLYKSIKNQKNMLN